MTDTTLPDPLAGRYTVLGVLGEGSHGRVLAARDTRLGSAVALKLLRDPGSGEALARRFLREARLLARVQHPSLIRILDQGVCRSGELYLVLKWITGGDLEGRRLDSGGRCPPEQVVDWGLPIAAALGCLHREGILHRDVKLANVLLRPGGEPVLADLGLARGLESGESALTASGAILGTPATMAPELWRGDPASPASDQFAWAACLAELLYGAPVWKGATLREIFEEVRSGAPLLAGPAPPDAPRSLSAALRRALEREPARRFPTMEDFGAALGEAMTPEGGPGRQDPSPQRTRVLPVPSQSLPEDVTHEVAPVASEPAARSSGGRGRPEGRPEGRRPPAPNMTGRIAGLGALTLVLALVWWGTREGPALRSAGSPGTPPASLDQVAEARSRLDVALEPFLSRHRGARGEVELPLGPAALARHRVAMEPWFSDPGFPDQCREVLQSYLSWNQAMAQARGWQPESPLAASGLELLSGPMLQILPHVLASRRSLARSGPTRAQGAPGTSPLAELQHMVPAPDAIWVQVRASTESFLADLGADLEVRTPDVLLLRAALTAAVPDDCDRTCLARLLEDLHGALLAEGGGPWGRLLLAGEEGFVAALGPQLPCALRWRCLGERAAWIEAHGPALGAPLLLACRLRVLREDVSAVDCLSQAGAWPDTALFDATLARLREHPDWRKSGLALCSQFLVGVSLIQGAMGSPGFRHRMERIHRELEALRPSARAP